MRRLLFKIASAIHVFVYRRTGGRFGGDIAGLHVLLLTTTGRKSGRRRTIPLGYFEHDGRYVIIGSNGGSDAHPAWFGNLRSEPRVTIQVKDMQMVVRG